MATPVGQVHELGAQMISVRLAVAGYRVVYLGANLPAAEIAHAAEVSSAHTVCLSLVFPAEDPLVATELERLARLLGPEVTVVLGGRAAASYDAVIKASGAARADTLDDLARLIAKN